MIEATMKRAKKKAMEKAGNMALDKIQDRVMSLPEKMFDGEVSEAPVMSGMGGMDAPHAPLIQSLAQYMPIEQMQGMQQGMPRQQANPYGSAMQSMGLMELLEQAARMR